MTQAAAKADFLSELRRAQFWYVLILLTLFVLFGLPVLRYLFIASYRVTPGGAIAVAGIVAGLAALVLSIRCTVREVKRVREERKCGRRTCTNWRPLAVAILSQHLLLSACIAIALDNVLGAAMVSDRALEAIGKGLFWFIR
jgi:hypothetical protein